MPGEITTLRETGTLVFDGPAVQNHEMDIETLAHELLAFRQLVEQANAHLNRRRTPIAVKVKGGFHEGSLTAAVVVDYLTAVIPLVPDILACVTSYIQIKQFLKGEPPKEKKALGDGMVQIQNAEGGTININNLVLTLNNSAPVNTALGRFAEPLGAGLDSISLQGVNTAPPSAADVRIVHEDRPALTPPMEDQIDATVRERDLEILASQNDGKPTNWRFYAAEDSVEFVASISDEQFLQDVRDKKYSFQYGDRIKARLNEVRRFVSQRWRTDRTIAEVLAYSRPEA